MTPGDFDPQTARAYIGDAQARAIEAKARTDADAQRFEPPQHEWRTYAGLLLGAMAAVVYREQFTKRTERNKRKANACDVK